ncbi:altered inheritance of mitochondria protein 3 [Acyrthosiphon pisum]|uniref:Uncharacterized protein n=1 Tax=Acyrthosiphon pisum TaxID=7029 RepID=A0A8R2A2I8_ACYPI|nr:altered inheritance of mitochondria protein 3 [Acyrthosiphon pisum]|eukprot:XP_001948652.2 PREDICTED: uncharacterized protein KIAA0754-like [Acyrthosiphon pisum]
MRIFGMECLKMCVVVGLALTAGPGRPAAAAPSPTNAYVFQQHKRSPADPNLDLTSPLTTEFGSFGPSATLPDFGYGSGFPSTAAGFGLNDAIDGLGTSAGLLHLSHPYSTTAFGSGFDSIGYPFSESTLNQLQFKPSLASGSSPSLPVSIKYSPSVANAGLDQTHITGLPATESAKPTAQKTVSLQQTRPNEQRVQAESFNAAPAPLQQSYSATVPVPQKQTYATYAPLQQSYPGIASAPLQQSYPTSVFIPRQQSYVTPISASPQQSFPAAASAPLQQSYPASAYVPQQQSYSAVIPVPLSQSYPGTASTAFQQSYVTAESIPQRQSYPATQSVPQQQSYSPSRSIPQQHSYPAAQSVPQQQSYSPSGSVPQQQLYQTSGSTAFQQSYVTAESVPQQQSYPATKSVPQQQTYSLSGSIQQQQSYSPSGSVPQQQSYQAALSAPLQQSYVAATSTPPQQSYPSTAEDFRISAYQPSASSGSASPLVTSGTGSAPDLILELRPPPYTAPASSVDYRQNVNIPSTASSSYPSADSNNNNNNYPGNNFDLLAAPVAGTSGPNQVSNAPNSGQLPGNTKDFLAFGSNAKPDQTPSNTYYTVPLPVSGSSNSASSGVPNYFSIPSISYSLTSTVNSEFAGSTSAPPAAAVSSTGGPSTPYRDTNSIPSLSFTNSNSISANSYSDSNSIQSSSYTIPSSPVAGNSYNDYKLNTEHFYGDSNSISPNSKRESSTVNPTEKFPTLG